MESILQLEFKDPSLLRLALIHRSCNLPEGNNQRLEFLGDAVLKLVIAEKLCADFPDANEGDLDHRQASLVNGHSLAAIARKLNLTEYLQVSKAHKKHHPVPSESMLEDALEALIGAVFLDAGFDIAREAVYQLFKEPLSQLHSIEVPKNPKGRLQEWSQQIREGLLPDYRELECEGPEHDRRYLVAVYLAGQELGRGSGRSKKAAEAAAAESALEKQS